MPHSLSLLIDLHTGLYEGIGNICKAMCGVAAGACGGAIDLYWATGNGDISEVNAKFSAQVGRKSCTAPCLVYLDL